MHKVRTLAAIVLGTITIAPIYADIAPVAGSTVGTFANPTGGSTVAGNEWSYDGRTGLVTFTGAAFSGSTPQSFNFGTIVLTNTGSQPTGTFTADLELAMTFTMPVGNIDFADGLQLNAQSGGGNSGHGDDLVLSFGGFPAPKTFTAGGEVYTVTYDGFFRSALDENTPAPDLFVINSPGGSATAYLWGTITADPVRVDEAAVPEPGSVLLLLTALGGCGVILRRRQKIS